MRETRKSNTLSQQSLFDDKKSDMLQQGVDHEYTQLFRQTQSTTQKTVWHILQDVAQRPAPQQLSVAIPTATPVKSNHDDDYSRTVSVTVADGANQKPQKSSSTATVMPAISSIRELIAYVPAIKNLATRGDLTGIPYLGDAFNAEDQKLINSISGEPANHARTSIRKNRLDEQSLETLYQSIRSNQAWDDYSNEQIIDAILHHHRDSTARSRLLALASQTVTPHNNGRRSDANIDTCDTVDADIDDLCIKPWCSRFCPRCYTYDCLLHKEKPSYLPLPSQFSLSIDYQLPQCSPTCYKHEREKLKRSLSPSYHDEEQNRPQVQFPTAAEPRESVRKRPRKSAPVRRILSADKLNLSHDENLHIGQYYLPMSDSEKKLLSSSLIASVENHLSHQSDILSATKNWTLTDRSLFRLFYFLCDGDLCTIKQFFDDRRTCQDMYQQFVSDAKYFSERTAATSGKAFSIRQPYRRRMLDGATRAFLLHIKKHVSPTSVSTLKSPYQPCQHDGPCTPTNSQCYCMKNGTYCEKYCNCPMDCPHRFPGCACKGACLLNNCLCCAEGRECDPDLCHKCGASLFPNTVEEPNPAVKSEPETVEDTSNERKTLPSLTRRSTRPKVNEQLPARQHSLRACRNAETSYRAVRQRTRRHTLRTSLNSNPSSNSSGTTCANISLQRKIYKQILIAESDVAGYGAFLGAPVAYPGDLIAEYTGEIITEEEADRRGRLYDKQACSYLFNLDTKRCVDARQFGSKIRFANHSSNPNCVPKIKLVNGDYRIGIYAKQVIFQGDELFFEYMYDAHQRQQFVNNERVDELEQDGFVILKRYGDNLVLVRPS